MKKTLTNLTLVCAAFLVFTGTSAINLSCTAQGKGNRISVVVIDAGHGGKDSGAAVGQAKEKDIVLDLAFRLGKSIQATYPDIKVVYTRTKDVFIPLHERAEIANRNKADLFISIHVNATDKKSVQGTETFVLGQHRSQENLEVAKKENSVILLEDDYNTTYEGFDPNSPESYIMFELVQDEYLEQSVMFASDIQNRFREGARRIDRSVKQAGFLVLRRTTMPSVLVEVGFISHAGERDFMMGEPGKAKLATSIFEAFREYKRKIEDKSSFNVRTHTANVPTEKKETIPHAAQKTPGSQPAKTADAGTNWYSVQIAASQRLLKTIPSNFMGEKNIFCKSSGNMHRYYSGMFENQQDAVAEKKRIEKKFPSAFVVSFENDKLIPLKSVTDKGK